MNIEISKHGLNFGEDLEYISTFIKGKGKPKVENYRILTKGVKTGEERLLMLEFRENLFGKDRYEISYIEGFKIITPDQLKFKNYNYYRLGYSFNSVDEFFTTWLKSDPGIHVGGYVHQFISKIKNYTWTYKFYNKTY